jgi:1,4-dihydroxy-2-naphthoate octaprenyltransferase
MNPRLQASPPFRAWWEAARPKTLIAGASPVILGSALAVRAGDFRPGAGIAALVCTLLLQIGANIANDYYDYRQGHDTPRRTGPRRAAASGLIPPLRLRRAVAAVFFAAVCAGVYLTSIGGPVILFTGIAAAAAAVFYTAGPVRLGASGLGEAAAFLFFGPVACIGTFYLHTGPPVHASGLIPAAVVSVSPGLFSLAILTVNNYRDREEDAATGKLTLAARFRPRFSKLVYIGSVTAALCIPCVWAAVSAAGDWAAASAGGWFPAAAVRPFCLPGLLLLGCIPVFVSFLRRAPGPWLNRTLAITGLFQALFTLVLGSVLILGRG